MISKRHIWAGRIISGLTVLFLLIDAAMKILRTLVAVQGTVQLGYKDSAVVGIGALLLACTIIYVIPRTSVLGAILLTGYLGGAVASQLRAGSPLLGFVLFPVYIGAMVWGGLYLRDARVRALISSR